MSGDKETREEVAVVVEESAESAGEESGLRRFRLRRSWAELRPAASTFVFASWMAAVLLVAVARVDPWNEWKSWRRWLRADERGWELVIPGLLTAGATWIYLRAHDRWSDEGWSPEVVGMVLLGTGAAFGGIFWGLHVLGLRPFTA